MVGALDAIHRATGEVHHRVGTLKMVAPMADCPTIPHRVLPRPGPFGHMPREQHDLVAELR